MAGRGGSVVSVGNNTCNATSPLRPSPSPGRQRLAALTRGGILLALLACAACSRSGSLYGDVVVPGPPGAGNAAAYLSVRAVAADAAFERDWASALAAFQQDLAPARQAREQAAAELEHARLAWDRAVAAPRNRRQSRAMSPQVQDLWRQVRRAEASLTRAKHQMEEVARRHGEQAVALLDRHAVQEVKTDALGHYVLPGLPAGAVYLYTRVTVRGQSRVWFRPVQVRMGAQQVDLNEESRLGWPFRV